MVIGRGRRRASAFLGKPRGGNTPTVVGNGRVAKPKVTHAGTRRRRTGSTLYPPIVAVSTNRIFPAITGAIVLVGLVPTITATNKKHTLPVAVVSQVVERSRLSRSGHRGMILLGGVFGGYQGPQQIVQAPLGRLTLSEFTHSIVQSQSGLVSPLGVLSLFELAPSLVNSGVALATGAGRGRGRRLSTPTIIRWKNRVYTAETEEDVQDILFQIRMSGEDDLEAQVDKAKEPGQTTTAPKIRPPPKVVVHSASSESRRMIARTEEDLQSAYRAALGSAQASSWFAMLQQDDEDIEVLMMGLQ